MKYIAILGVLALALLLVVGCADKKDEVADLENEMMAQEQPEANAAEAVPDTTQEMAEPETPPDASAIPQEDTHFESSPPVGGGYTVQVASCERLEYARHLVETYVERGYEAYLTSTVVEGQTYYRVRIGGVPTFSEAKTLQAELIDKYSVHESWIDIVGE